MSLTLILFYSLASDSAMAEIQIYQFKNIQLFKDLSLGIGSYGTVCKAKCDDLLCAAKIIHPTLFNPTLLHQMAPQRKHRLPIRRFEQECEFMSAIRHPNIVQYLGIFRDTDTHLPVLLMELMDESLTHFLESSTVPISYNIQVNICHDVALALSFLHSNNIVHRDLSSNNILLIGNMRAKVSDFGMARLSDINSHATCFTMCPGTDVYMPPEAVQDKPVYTEKLDCFSFGVITVQVLTQQFPNPGDRFQTIELNHPGLPTGSVLVQVPEVKRRQNHICQIPSNHLLLPIALDCLKDKSNERPSAHQLCERVADLKENSEYMDLVGMVIDKDEVIRSQTKRMKEYEQTIQSKDEEIQQLKWQLQQQSDRANIRMEEKENQLNSQLRQIQLEGEKQFVEKEHSGEVNQQFRQLQQKSIGNEEQRPLGYVNSKLEATESVVAQFERRITEIEHQLCLTSLKLSWRVGNKAPCRMRRWCDAVVDGNMVYIRDGDSVRVYSYDVTKDSWSQLPNCVLEGGSIIIISCWLTTIGGFCNGVSNELFSLTGEGSGRKWIKKFPPMPTKRKYTTAVCTETSLIVAGGMGSGVGSVLSIVEVMNTESHQWSIAADLPQPMYTASGKICGERIYILGGVNKDTAYIKSVYTCSVSDLLQSCISSSLKARSHRIHVYYKANVWRQVADLPFTRSTCASFHSRLLAIGGRVDYAKASSNVYMYNSATNSWEIISHMASGRYDCFAAVLPDNQLMVVGSFVTGGSPLNDTVEFASVSS